MAMIPMIAFAGIVQMAMMTGVYGDSDVSGCCTYTAIHIQQYNTVRSTRALLVQKCTAVRRC